METNNKKEKTKYRKGQEVYLTAFLKKEKGIFYICRGTIEEVPAPNERQIYRVKIVAIADRAIGRSNNPEEAKQKVVHQARLLGLVCSKRVHELNETLPVFLMPKNWIDKTPES